MNALHASLHLFTSEHSKKLTLTDTLPLQFSPFPLMPIFTIFYLAPGRTIQSHGCTWPTLLERMNK
jgi:hypothetical protein